MAPADGRAKEGPRPARFRLRPKRSVPWPLPWTRVGGEHDLGAEGPEVTTAPPPPSLASAWTGTKAGKNLGTGPRSPRWWHTTSIDSATSMAAAAHSQSTLYMAAAEPSESKELWLSLI